MNYLNRDILDTGKRCDRDIGFSYFSSLNSKNENEFKDTFNFMILDLCPSPNPLRNSLRYHIKKITELF